MERTTCFARIHTDSAAWPLGALHSWKVCKEELDFGMVCGGERGGGLICPAPFCVSVVPGSLPSK